MAAFEFFTIPEAATQLRISSRTMWKLLQRGKGPRTTTVGDKRFISKEHLVAWIETNTTAAGARSEATQDVPEAGRPK